MKLWKPIVAAALVSVAALSTAVASPRLLTPRPAATAGSFRPASNDSTIAALGIGSPNSFAMGDAWLTSDLLPDDFNTELIWYDDENLSIIAGFYTTKTNDITATWQVKNQSGTTVFTETFTGPPFPNDITIATLPIGMLPAGPGGETAAYKVIVKIKQGIKVIGQQFWIPVISSVARPAQPQ